MGRVINSELPAKHREQVCRLIIAAIDNLLDNEKIDNLSINDLIAFILLSLKNISKTISQTTSQWEKRGYWVKAEKFKVEWEWTEQYYDSMLKKKSTCGWKTIPQEISQIKVKLSKFTANNKISGNFWLGAYDHVDPNN